MPSKRSPGFIRSSGVQDTFWDIIASLEKAHVAPPMQENKRSAQAWLLRAAAPLGAIKNGGDSSGEKPEYAMALFRLERAEALLRLIGNNGLADRLCNLMARLRKLREAR